MSITTRSHEVPIPPSLAGLLELAFDDLKACRQSRVYVENMGAWHTPTSAGCQVCLAGAVLAQTLKLPSNQIISMCELDINANWKDALQAIDSMIWGRWAAAIKLRYSDRAGSYIDRALTSASRLPPHLHTENIPYRPLQCNDSAVEAAIAELRRVGV